MTVLVSSEIAIIIYVQLFLRSGSHWAVPVHDLQTAGLTGYREEPINSRESCSKKGVGQHLIRLTQSVPSQRNYMGSGAYTAQNYSRDRISLCHISWGLLLLYDVS